MRMSTFSYSTPTLRRWSLLWRFWGMFLIGIGSLLVVQQSHWSKVDAFSGIPKTIRSSPLVQRSGVLSPSTVTFQQPPTHEEEAAASFLSKINPLYFGLWTTFLIYGIALSPGQVGDPADTHMIQAYIDDPTAPVGINSFFLIVFNALGIVPLIVAQLACPQGRRTGLPAAPFLAASMGMGFGAAGLYLSFRDAPVSQPKSPSETSWVTRYLLESKWASVLVLGLFSASIASAVGAATASGQDWSTILSEYVTLTQQSKFVSVSTLDLIILTIAAATLIPRDYALRVGSGNDEDDDDDEEPLAVGTKIATATLVLPILGAALYCLWRPSLPDTNE